LTLPIADQVAVSEHDDQIVYAEFKARIAALSRPVRVLIVDDNPTNRLVAANMLKEFEIHTSIASNGLEAVTAASAFHYDIILMDVRMPEMDGLQATRAIRASEGESQHVPIIAFTANAFAEDVAACREAGMNDMVVKPVRKAAMVEAILRALWSAAAIVDTDPAVVAPPLVPAVVPSTEATSAIDRKVFEDLVSEIGKETAAETLVVFIKETDDCLKLLQRLSIETDRKIIERQAHSLKGTAATFGLREVAQLARLLERNAPQITAGDYHTLLDQIEAAFSHAHTQYLTPVLFVCTGPITS
jgi:CheY-like chemotaxis protein/HPt (histidine-containing phosphotransfer) domain-containing protein